MREKTVESKLAHAAKQRGGTFPHYMKNDKKIRTGHYRVYKYKNGFCMKRNEQLKEET